MNYRVTTAVTTEPVTLDEAKNHIRLTSGTFAGDTITYQTITPADHVEVAAFGLEGTAIDVLGVITLVNLNSGTNGSGGTVTAKIQESDDNINWQDFEDGGFTVVTESNDNAIQEIEYTAGKQYIRVVATVAGASCNFSADVVTKTGSISEDNQIEMWITAAREYCENATGRGLATQTIEQYLDHFPYLNCIELVNPPLQSVASVVYKDSAGNETTLVEDTDYIVDTDSSVGRIVLPYSKLWPIFIPYSVNAVTITLTAGYFTSRPIPKPIKQAILLLIGHWYENREAVMTGAVNMTKKIEFAVDNLLAMYQVRWL